jgi:hypothetical protein
MTHRLGFLSPLAVGAFEFYAGSATDAHASLDVLGAAAGGDPTRTTRRSAANSTRSNAATY